MSSFPLLPDQGKGMMANWAAISSVDDMFNPMFGGKLRPFYKGYELQRVLITKGIGNKGYQQQKVSFASAICKIGLQSNFVVSDAI